MNYHLSQNGQEVGVFPLDELRRRREMGELSGQEQVWTEGMAQWQTLDSVLQSGFPPALPKFIAPAPLSPNEQRGMNPIVPVLVVLGVLIIGGFSTFFGVNVYRAIQLAKQVRTGNVGQLGGQASAMEAARKPVLWTATTRTAADVQKAGREFRVRQYIAGYQLRGDRNPECDTLALGFLTNWVASNFGGPMDTNLPTLSALSHQLAGDPSCQDPLLLTVAAVNAVNLHDINRRLERAVKGFENSKHLGYPKFFATVMLSDKLIKDQASRYPALDAKALTYLKEALTDGSIQPGDEEILADVLANDWGRSFFNRNAAAVCSLTQQQGDKYQWLALVLTGEYEIDAAWRARGSGWANQVSGTGWKGFEDHLATARDCLTRAWKLHPERPLAPDCMIKVSLGDSGIEEMRKWFDRTVAAQLDYADAWNEMRWGLRPRWFGDYNSMLAFGVTALNTKRFDTDVPRNFFDSVSDLEAEMNLPGGQRLFGRADIWPHIEVLYNGYISEPSVQPYTRDGWRSTYAVVSYLAGKYDVARKQLEALNWQPQPWSLDGWYRDLTVLPEEVAARTGLASAEVNDAEQFRLDGDIKEALLIYQGLSAKNNLDQLTGTFVRERLATLGMEQQFATGDWVDFLPKDTNFTGWHAAFGKFNLQPDGSLEVQSDESGHMIYSRARLGTEFEVRGQFELVSNTTTAFQAGLVMGIPQYANYNWYAFRVKRNKDEGDLACFSQNWSTRQISAQVPLDDHTNTFDLRFQHGLVSATVDGREVFNDAPPPRGSYVCTNEFFIGLGAFNHSNSTVIRYRQLQVRKLGP